MAKNVYVNLDEELTNPSEMIGEHLDWVSRILDVNIERLDDLRNGIFSVELL